MAVNSRWSEISNYRNGTNLWVLLAIFCTNYAVGAQPQISFNCPPSHIIVYDHQLAAMADYLAAPPRLLGNN